MKKIMLIALLLLSGTSMFSQDHRSPKFKEKNEDLYEFVEVQPEYPGGMEAMMLFLQQNIKYPAAAAKQKIQGKVFVKFIVKKDGLIGDVTVVRGVHQLLDDEACRVIKLMPRWKPGEQRGKKVSVWYTIPISFKL